jgi:hypothetical protein
MQGFAAASMLFCGGGLQQHVHAATLATTATATVSGHHDHAMHGQADSQATHSAHGASTGTSHKCSICAACCNSMALIATRPLLTVAPASQSTLAEPLVLIHTIPAPVPDKPPRA